MARTVLELNPVVYQSHNIFDGEDFDNVNGMMFENNGNQIFYIQNQSMSSVTITVASVPDEAGRTGDDVAVLEAGKTARFGTYDPRWWNQSEDDYGYVYVDSTAGTDVKVYGVNLNFTVRPEEEE